MPWLLWELRRGCSAEPANLRGKGLDLAIAHSEAQIRRPLVREDQPLQPLDTLQGGYLPLMSRYVPRQ